MKTNDAVNEYITATDEAFKEYKSTVKSLSYDKAVCYNAEVDFNLACDRAGKKLKEESDRMKFECNYCHHNCKLDLSTVGGRLPSYCVMIHDETRNKCRVNWKMIK